MKKSAGFLIIIIIAAYLYSLRGEAFPIYDATVTWVPPTHRVDGTLLTDLDHYEILRGICGQAQSVVAVAPAGSTSKVVPTERLSLCWTVLAVDINNNKSDPSNVEVFFPTTDTDNDGVMDFVDNCTLLSNVDQVDSDADGYGNACDGDLNGNGVTNAQDYTIFRAQLGMPSEPPIYNPSDFNASGYVNAQDYVLFRQQMLGNPPGPSGVKP